MDGPDEGTARPADFNGVFFDPAKGISDPHFRSLSQQLVNDVPGRPDVQRVGRHCLDVLAAWGMTHEIPVPAVLHVPPAELLRRFQAHPVALYRQDHAHQSADEAKML